MGSVTYEFAGETAVVAGGSSGIGRAIALAFGRAGATVINADVRRDPKSADAPTDEADYVTGEPLSVDGGWPY
jgi:NAD(P)-dependent dehydrogenase (short-subunit alcohol dehydrogenase family)